LVHVLGTRPVAGLGGEFVGGAGVTKASEGALGGGGQWLEAAVACLPQVRAGVRLYDRRDHRRLAGGILDGVLAPSTWLREDELASELSVSRTPVREALRRLSDERLAVRLTNRGTVVTSMSLDDVLALFLVREQLEGLAARLAAVRQPPGL